MYRKYSNIKIRNTEYRRIIIKGYVIVYDIDAVGSIVYIDGVFYHSEDYYKNVLDKIFT